MMPGGYPLNIYRGDTHAWRFSLWHDAEKTIPVNLAGIAVKAEIRDRPSGALIFPLTCVVTLPNEIEASLTATETKTLPASGRWDLQLTDLTARVSTILAGPVKVTGDITDSEAAAAAEAIRSAGYLTEPAP
jgi:hypothetical protein